jgi:hypothetical protein
VQRTRAHRLRASRPTQRKDNTRARSPSVSHLSHDERKTTICIPYYPPLARIHIPSMEHNVAQSHQHTRCHHKTHIRESPPKLAQARPLPTALNAGLVPVFFPLLLGDAAPGYRMGKRTCYPAAAVCQLRPSAVAARVANILTGGRAAQRSVCCISRSTVLRTLGWTSTEPQTPRQTTPQLAPHDVLPQQPVPTLSHLTHVYRGTR